jgi:hypothetical protein
MTVKGLRSKAEGFLCLFTPPERLQILNNSSEKESDISDRISITPLTNPENHDII